MKKTVKKLQLSRETLIGLEKDAQVKYVVGGASFQCGSTSVDASGCNTRCTCTSVYC